MIWWKWSNTERLDIHLRQFIRGLLKAQQRHTFAQISHITFLLKVYWEPSVGLIKAHQILISWLFDMLSAFRGLNLILSRSYSGQVSFMHSTSSIFITFQHKNGRIHSFGWHWWKANVLVTTVAKSQTRVFSWRSGSFQAFCKPASGSKHAKLLCKLLIFIQKRQPQQFWCKICVRKTSALFRVNTFTESKDSILVEYLFEVLLHR